MKSFTDVNSSPSLSLYRSVVNFIICYDLLAPYMKLSRKRKVFLFILFFFYLFLFFGIELYLQL